MCDKQWHLAEKNGTKFEVVTNRQHVFIHQETGSGGGGGGHCHHGLLELRGSRPQLEVESEWSAT
jgi:hypothetical protein